MSATTQQSVTPDARGRYGPFGGRYVPETLVAPLEELESAYAAARAAPKFRAELDGLLRDFAGRLGTRVLALVPFSPRIGMRITTQGHYYRPTAEAVVEVLHDARSLVTAS